MNWLVRLGKGSTDRLVQFASGQTPVKALDESHAAFRVVLIIAILTFSASGWLLWRTISTAAKLPSPPNVNQSQNSAEIAALRNKDTDSDGLTDYEELFTYNSSPYLYSSASDDISDGDKVKDGLNPNCPKGKTCSLPTVNLSAPSSGEVDVSFLRSALKASGAPAATVDQADDSTILALYQQALSNSNGDATNTSSQPTVENLERMSGSQIRALLSQNGVDDTTLSKVDDATLKAVFQEIISTDSTTQ